jgi:hypothetical protein
MTEKINVNEILDNLAYSISSAESEYLGELIKECNYKEATKILSDYCSEEEITLLFEHFKKESERKYSLEEIALEGLIKSVTESYEKKENINLSLLVNFDVLPALKRRGFLFYKVVSFISKPFTSKRVGLALIFRSFVRHCSILLSIRSLLFSELMLDNKISL